MNILQAIDDPKVFGAHFRDAESWRPWRTFLGALFGIPLDRAFFVRLSATFAIDVPASVCEVGGHDINQPGRFGGRVFPLDDTINPHALASAIQSSRDFVQTASSLAKCGVTPMSLGM